MFRFDYRSLIFVAIAACQQASAQVIFDQEDSSWEDPWATPSRENHSCNQTEPCQRDEFYYNELACRCFSKFQCRVGCPDGQQLDPEQNCECIDQNAIDELYPDWASPQDIADFANEGFERSRARPEGQNWRVCPKEDHAQEVGQCYAQGQYWNELSCQCFSMIFCMMMCPPGEDMDPTLGCSCMDKEELRETYYPFWATPFEIDTSLTQGMEDWSNRLKVCPIENEPADRCRPGFYWNELACECFAAGQCKRLCPEEGQQLSPLARCECVDDSVVDDLYPFWVDKYDKQQAIEDGLANHRNNRKPATGQITALADRSALSCPSESRQCQANFYFNELACMCFSMAMCYSPCPSNQFDMPTRDCGCTESEQEYLDLFPVGSTDEDIAESIKHGMTHNAFQ